MLNWVKKANLRPVKKQLIIIFFIGFSALGAPGKGRKPIPSKPLLVLGIVVDQMRQDYLFRFAPNFSRAGFRRMLKEGHSFSNCRYSYVPTYTAPGHASLFTGTTPFVHGIVGNHWIQQNGKMRYCTDDDTVRGIGTEGKSGKMSPASLKAGSIADQIRLASDFRGKAFGISLKDRGAILPAGHSANAAFWFDFKTGNFISSSWYRELKGRLPGWLEKFNSSGPVKSCLDSTWKPLLPLPLYASGADNHFWEKGLIEGKDPVFPYRMKDAGGAEKLAASPFGNSVLAALAKELILQEGLGRDSIMDFLSLSFSSTDIVGHAYGPNSLENEDCYLRLDRELEKLFAFLDSQVGEGQWLCFLSSDHGVMENPLYLNSRQIPAKLFSADTLMQNLHDYSLKSTGRDWFSGLENLQLYWNEEYFRQSDSLQSALEKQIVRWLEKQNGICRAFPLSGSRPWPEPPNLDKVVAGYYRGRSGHIQLMTEPFFLNQESPKGTTHGSPHSYDSHVPCLWLGWKIAPGEDLRPVAPEDVAPSLSALLRIASPNAATGKIFSIPLR